MTMSELPAPPAHADLPSGFAWTQGECDGKPCLELRTPAGCVGVIWEVAENAERGFRRFVWHTFDARGIGGENDADDTLGVAARAVWDALVRQGWVGEVERDGASISRSMFSRSNMLSQPMPHHENPRPSDLPPDPPWLGSWLESAGAQELAALRELAGAASPALRAALVAYPPGCVARCVCGDPKCSRLLAIVTGAAEHPKRGILLLLRRSPEDADHEIPLASARYQVEHFRGGVTPELVRALFASAAGSA